MLSVGGTQEPKVFRVLVKQGVSSILTVASTRLGVMEHTCLVLKMEGSHIGMRANWFSR